MTKKEDKLHQKRLRRLANQIVGQLPEEFECLRLQHDRQRR
jgi:hypothetical protein